MKYCKTRKSAIKKGRLHYKTGKYCSLGHDSIRYTKTGRCVECDRIHSSTRRESIKIRTPIWACKDTIDKIYNNVPVGYSVDHIIPLRGDFVSGLHIPENLIIIPLSENLSKKNNFCLE